MARYTKSPFGWLFPERHHWPKEKPASVNRRITSLRPDAPKDTAQARAVLCLISGVAGLLPFCRYFGFEALF
jgi:hypothetical protein